MGISIRQSQLESIFIASLFAIPPAFCDLLLQSFAVLICVPKQCRQLMSRPRNSTQFARAELHLRLFRRTRRTLRQSLSLLSLFDLNFRLLHLLHSINLRSAIFVSLEPFECTLLQAPNIRIIFTLPLSPEFLIVRWVVRSPLTRRQLIIAGILVLRSWLRRLKRRNGRCRGESWNGEGRARG